MYCGPCGLTHRGPVNDSCLTAAMQTRHAKRVSEKVSAISDDGGSSPMADGTQTPTTSKAPPSDSELDEREAAIAEKERALQRRKRCAELDRRERRLADEAAELTTRHKRGRSTSRRRSGSHDRRAPTTAPTFIKLKHLGRDNKSGMKEAQCVRGMAVYSARTNTVDLSITPLITCKLCLTECVRKDMYELRCCQCLYCPDCVTQYLTVMITEGTVMMISCPDASCRRQGKMEASEIEKLVDKSLYSRYVRLKFQREVELDPARTWCPEVGCETICHVCVAGVEHQIQPMPVHCPTCQLMFCSTCKSKWHLNQTCDEFMKSGRKEDEGIPFSNDEDAQIKRCPLCHVPIERNDGCAQMMCKRCKHVFCWYCLASLDDDFLLRHYDKGPCKNKLGHSRASIIWHRTQVIAIFAGFGVLLLVASPFLLLAAPCILCCKCSTCKCCDDNDQDSVPT